MRWRSIVVRSQPDAPTPRRAPGAIFGIREFGSAWCGGAALRRGGEQLSVEPGEDLRPTVVGPETEDQLTAALDESAGSIDQLLHHGLQAAALGHVAYRRIGPEQSALARQAQDVHRQRR